MKLRTSLLHVLSAVLSLYVTASVLSLALFRSLGSLFEPAVFALMCGVGIVLAGGLGCCTWLGAGRRLGAVLSLALLPLAVGVLALAANATPRAANAWLSLSFLVVWTLLTVAIHLPLRNWLEARYLQEPQATR
jgi:hypothetical protein